MDNNDQYRIALILSESAMSEAWVRLAVRMLPEGQGEILLRGMITIPKDRSLTEGTIRAQEMRDHFDNLARVYPVIRGENWVRVDYKPLERVIGELAADPVDLLLVQWRGPRIDTGGVDTDYILEHAPCDICLICGEQWQHEGPVLLSLHGGPNISVGINVSRALSETATISVLHAANEATQDAAELNPLLGIDGGVSRVVTVRSESDILGGVLRESVGHKIIVIGAAFFESDSEAIASGRLVEHIFDQTRLPVALVRARKAETLAFRAPRLLYRDEDISTRVDRWFAENTFNSEEFADLESLLRLKTQQGLTISIALPALNEEETVGDVINTLKTAFVDNIPLVDEIVLIDSNSTDNTVEIAKSYDIPVYKHPDILPEIGSVRGKGEALWKSLHICNGDIIAWVDTDIKNIHPRFIYGLLGPLLKHPHIQYVKGYYHRPILVGDQLQAYGGGRVTELVARPLFNLFYPELSGIVQPLAGEYAGRRSALERVPFFSGYGVETGLLIDLHDVFGLGAIAQTNLKERVHHNQPLVGLSKMAFAILQVFISRLEDRYGVQLLDHTNRSMKLITQTPERLALDVTEIGDRERPPIISLDAYKARRQKSTIQ